MGVCDFWSHGAIAQKYWIFRDKNGFSEWANVIVGKKQQVVFVKIYPVHSVPDIERLLRFWRNEPGLKEGQEKKFRLF